MMALKLNKIFFILCVLSCQNTFSQENDGPKPPKVTDYKNDSSYTNYNNLRYKVAQAQINLLKNDGALLVRLKTNANTIAKLKTAGNIDLATQVERETMLKNKTIIASYQQEFTFCPVYFFYSNFSDSVKHKNIQGIFVDSNLLVNPNIVCNATFYLIAEADKVYNSSLGIVPESEASKAIESGTPTREAAIVLKNRYFIQLHKPFPFFQIKGNTEPSIMISHNVAYFNLSELQSQVKKYMSSQEAKPLLKLKGCVSALNEDLFSFYAKNKGYTMPSSLAQYIY
ncbi:MAG: hypothetical protein V4565_00730 [Bacteroidota bacterium]